MVYSTRRFVLCLPGVILFLCFSVLKALRLPRLGKIQLILVLFVRLFDLRLFLFVCFLFFLVSGKAPACNCGIPWTFFLTPLIVVLPGLFSYLPFKSTKLNCHRGLFIFRLVLSR